MTQYITRLRGEKCELDDTLIEEGRGDGAAYGKNTTYRELRLIEKLVDSVGANLNQIDAYSLASAVCEVDLPDMDANEWIESNLSKSWHDEEPYIRGFINGAMVILEEIDSVES
jgi:hypothetical protein